MSTRPPPLEAVLRGDRAVVVLGLAAVTVTAWAYLVHKGRSMGSMDMEGMGAVGVAQDLVTPQALSWGAVDVLLLFAMWVVMMVAMMVPSVAPLVLTFVRVDDRTSTGRGVGSAGVLLLGYLLAWTAFSLVATAVQWALHRATLLSAMMVSTSAALGGLLLMAAGMFQLTPLKRACLKRCRSPMGFLMEHWQAGRTGSFSLGLRHGTYCVGCCWALMALLFVAGVMNLLWVASIAGFVLIEKLAPEGETIGRVGGIMLIAAGVAVVLG